MAEGANARVQRGAGRVQVNRVPYVVDLALDTLKDVRQLVLVGAKSRWPFFAYPDKPSVLGRGRASSTARGRGERHRGRTRSPGR